MKPVGFEEQNKVYKAPANWDEERLGPCGDLPVHQDYENGTITSCYELDMEDIIALNRGCKLYFTIWAQRQPVVGWEIR